MNKLIHNKTDIVEDIARWIEESGFKGNLSALTAGLHDIDESIKEIHQKFIPSLLKLKPNEYKKALDIIIDLIFELEHILKHSNDGIESLVRVRDFFDKSHISKRT